LERLQATQQEICEFFQNESNKHETVFNEILEQLKLIREENMELKEQLVHLHESTPFGSPAPARQAKSPLQRIETRYPQLHLEVMDKLSTDIELFKLKQQNKLSRDLEKTFNESHVLDLTKGFADTKNKIAIAALINYFTSKYNAATGM
jgi:hypothetical protein